MTDFPDSANKKGVEMGKESSLYLMSLTIQDILQWIERNIAEPLPLGVLAQKSGYSAWHFQRGFKKIAGISPGMYIRYRKMVIARELLTETNRSITEIALHLGYQQQSTFCRAFREHYQRTPRQYRLQVQSGSVKDKAVSE